MKFNMQFGEHDIEITAEDFEHSPEINFTGPNTLYANYADTGEPYDFGEGEEDQAFQRACEIAWED